jgi:hypothetical protein
VEKSIKVLHWLPRIICILAILFVSMFALDAFSPQLTIWQQLVDFFMHLIPSFVLLAMLAISWKWENIGGIIFIIGGLAFSAFVFFWNYRMNHSILMSLGIIGMVTFPFIAVGVLFIVSHRLKKKKLPAA